MIALCGAPGAGKTEVQAYLAQTYGVHPVDDGHPLRDFAVRHLGLSAGDVLTQAGKASVRVFPGGRHLRVREALGELGNRIEELFGPDAIPEMAYNWAKHHAQVSRCAGYSFGSVRRQQGRFYGERGAVVVEIVRPGCVIENEFDEYDPTLASLTIYNNSTLTTLYSRIEYHLGPLFRGHTH